jgi:hypothetical protein
MERCDAVLEDTGEEIRKVDFIKEYMAARKLAFLPETVMKAWAGCGICPLNPKIFSDADFAPSASTSTKGHMLTSYSAEFYGEESDLDRDENEDEDRELDDNDDDGSDSEDETEGTTNLEPPDMSTDNAPVEVTHNRPTKRTRQPPNPLAIANPILNPISHYPLASTCSHICLPPITISMRKHMLRPRISSCDMSLRRCGERRRPL